MEGMFVSDITPNSFYAQLGIRPDDIIYSVNGMAINNMDAAKKILVMFEQDQELTLEIQRGDNLFEMTTSTLQGVSSDI
jgi:S1-C subfamily serine protease